MDLKYFTYHPSLFPRMLGDRSGGGKPGEIVHIYDKHGGYFGTGFSHPRGRIPVRVFHHGSQPAGEDLLLRRLAEAVALRHHTLGLDDPRGACRLVHGDADGVPGLSVDRYADTLSVEVATLAAWQRLPQWLPVLHQAAGTRRAVVRADAQAARIEGIRGEAGDRDVRPVKIDEHGVRHEVDFRGLHKTGFFCDQRENRRRLGEWTRARPVLDLCTCTGGFALAARVLGQSPEVTAVDLDEHALERARRNANLNEVRLKLVHADAFDYARQMAQNGRRWPVIILDPPKFVHGREEREAGLQKYHDLNRLALDLLEPGGLFITCSCSGLVDEGTFEQTVVRAAHRLGRPLRILDRTGAGPDHPVLSTCPETRYLKVMWATG